MLNVGPVVDDVGGTGSAEMGSSVAAPGPRASEGLRRGLGGDAGAAAVVVGSGVVVVVGDGGCEGSGSCGCVGGEGSEEGVGSCIRACGRGDGASSVDSVVVGSVVGCKAVCGSISPASVVCCAMPSAGTCSLRTSSLSIAGTCGIPSASDPRAAALVSSAGTADTAGTGASTAMAAAMGSYLTQSRVVCLSTI